MNRQPFLALLLLAIVAVAIVILATRFGIGITPDSTVYTEAARNLLGGRGLIALTAGGELKPMTHYPPLYPSLLALIGLMHLSIESAARWLQALLFGANVLVVGFTIARYARDSFWLPIVGGLLMLTAPDILGIHTLALTEPLFVLLTISCLVSLARFRETNRWSWLITAAAFAAFALLTRYVAAALIITGVVALLLGRRDWRRRLGSAFTFGTIACAPLALWLIRNALLTGAETDRQMAFHPPGLKQVGAAFSTVASWLLVGKVRGDLRVGFFLAEVVLIALFFFYLVKESSNSQSAPSSAGRKSQTDGNLAQLSIVLIIFIVCYVGFIVIATSFFDLVIFDERTLLPIHVVSIIMLTSLAAQVRGRFQDKGWLRIALVVTAIALIGSYSLRAASWFNRTRRDGQGYASRAWKESETIQRVKNLPVDVPIYSNAYDAIYYLTGRPSILIPEKSVFVTGRPNQNYEAELEKMRTTLQDRKGVLVYFNTLPERWYLPADSELKTRLSLTAAAAAADASIYRVNSVERQE